MGPDKNEGCDLDRAIQATKDSQTAIDIMLARKIREAFAGIPVDAEIDKNTGESETYD